MRPLPSSPKSLSGPSRIRRTHSVSVSSGAGVLEALDGEGGMADAFDGEAATEVCPS
jgi:hypothetical protein